MSVSDTELKEFLEGRLDAAAAERIEAMMLADPSLERRLMAMDGLSREVREAMAHLPDDARINAIGAPLTASPQVAARPPRRWIGLAAAALVGLAIGWGGGVFTQSGAQDWRVEVAHYQALYTGDTLAGIDATEEELVAQLSRAAAMIGADLPKEGLDAIPGMELRRAQILGFADRPLAQIVYRADGGAPIALCLTRTGGEDSAVEVSELQGMAAASWAEGGVEYLLIGGDDIDWIAARASEARAALAGA
ncbi:MAG: anti-sigma factor [Pseudomonadota bacterium]